MTAHFPKIVYWFLLIVLTVSVQAQEIAKKPYVLSLAPLSLVDIYDGASLRPGIEIPLNDKLAFGLESGIYLPYLNETKMRPHGYLIRPSLKYYFAKKGERTNKYIEGDYFFKDQDYNIRDSLEVGDLRFSKRYAMQRKIHALSVRYGKVVSLGKKYRLDYYAGIGVRYIDSKSDLTEAESDAILTGSDGDCTLQQDIIRKTGYLWQPNFLLGLKIGFEL